MPPSQQNLRKEMKGKQLQVNPGEGELWHRLLLSANFGAFPYLFPFLSCADYESFRF